MEHDVHQHLHHHQQAVSMEVMELPPGFRFHPTDEELITHYLARKAADPRFAARAVAEADLNKCEPWDLPSRATWGEKEWYFFCVKDRKYPTGLRTNRATESGYWKATGKDREIFRGKALVGMKKTLVFYTGRAPRGGKTGWVMHEYRLDGKHVHATSGAGAGSSSSLIHSIKAAASTSSRDEWVLCRVFKKNIEQPAVAGGGGKRPPGSSSSTFMGMEDGVGPSSMSMVADELVAACALPPLMDVSSAGSGGGIPTTTSLSASAAAAAAPSIQPQLPPPAHVTCFSNALEAPFLNHPLLFNLPSSSAPAAPAAATSAVAAADQYLAAMASPYMSNVQMHMHYVNAGATLAQEAAGGGGWYSKQLGDRERLSGGGASQDTGLTSSEVMNPAEISSSSRQHMTNHEASLWDY